MKLTFGNTLPTGVSAGSTDEAVVSITDDDVPAVAVSFAAAAYTVTEGGTETVTVTLNANPERTVIIPITTTDQDGASSSDYSGVPGSITFNAGDTEVDINFSATQDQDNDDGESVKLIRGPADRGECWEHQRGCGHITDDDVPRRETVCTRNRGKHGDGHGHAERRSRTHGHHTDHQYRPGLPCRLLRRARKLSPSTQATARWTSTSAPPRTRTTTTARA